MQLVWIGRYWGMGQPEGKKGFEELKAVFISFAEDLAKLVVSLALVVRGCDQVYHNHD